MSLVGHDGKSLNAGAEARFVAHFDILGMAGLTTRDPDKAWALLSKLAGARNRILNLKIAEMSTGTVIENRLAWLTFSDTILAFSEGDSKADAQAMGLLAGELFAAALAGSVPLRGGIAHGRFLFNPEESLYLGPALVEAYTLSECSQWLGIALSEECARRFGEAIRGAVGGGDAVVDWQLPWKDGSVRNGPVFNWVSSHRANLTIPPPILVRQFYRAFEQLFGQYDALEPRSRAKYEETTRFVNAMLA